MKFIGQYYLAFLFTFLSFNKIKMTHRLVYRGNRPRVEIPGYEGIYEINDLGQIRSYWKNNNKENRVDTEPQRLLQPRRKHMKKYGDKAVVTLFDGLKHRHHYVGRLVAQVFMGLDPKDKKCQIVHKDGNNMNCDKRNLIIATPSERQLNYLHGIFNS